MTTAGITGKLKEKIRETKTTKIQNFNWKLAKAFTLQNIKWFEGTYLFQGAKKIPPKVIEKILRENALVPQTKFWEVFADFSKTLEARIRI